MKSNAKYKNEEIEELLESDDDLPNVYDEIPDIPAFQNDRRFESRTEDDKKSELPDELSLHVAEEKNATNSQHKLSERILIRKGLLSKQDVYCLKSIETLISDTTLLWLIDFFMYKDLQSEYKIQSCLVADIMNNHSMQNVPCDTDVKDYRLKLIFKD